MRRSYAIDKMKSRGSVIRNNFLEYRTKQTTLFARRMICMHCSLQISKKGGKDQESIQSSTTPDPGYQWESN